MICTKDPHSQRVASAVNFRPRLRTSLMVTSVTFDGELVAERALYEQSSGNIPQTNPARPEDCGLRTAAAEVAVQPWWFSDARAVSHRAEHARRAREAPVTRAGSVRITSSPGAARRADHRAAALTGPATGSHPRRHHLRRGRAVNPSRQRAVDTRTALPRLALKGLQPPRHSGKIHPLLVGYAACH
jgi:hypothetical protein